MTTTLTLAPPARTTVRRLTGFKPTGQLHLGNYFGAIRPMLDAATPTADPAESIIMLADLHALTIEHDPDRLRALTTQMLATLLACGIDPARRLVYVQSDVTEHAELHYLLECATGYGEAARMIQFRTRVSGSDPVRLSLLTYPVLMAADILLHDTDEVPVGDDQRQHVELARDVANRFNTRYGRTFTVPRGVTPPVAARIMDLSDPTGKMGKSSIVDSGVIYLLDKPELVRRKVSRAVTDTGGDVSYEPDRKPGVSNLLEILAACEGAEPASIAQRYHTYAQLKQTVTDAVVETLAPVRQRYDELVADRGLLQEIRRSGAQRASERARATVTRAKHAIGLAS